MCILLTERKPSSRPWRWDGESWALVPTAHYRHKGKRYDGAQLLAGAHNYNPSSPTVRRQNAHVYTPGWIIDPDIKAGDSLCSCPCPGSEHSAPENFFLLASAQPRLRSICSQRCPKLRRGACEAAWMFHKAQIYAALGGNIPIYPLHLPARLRWQQADRWRGLCRCMWHLAPVTFPHHQYNTGCY